MITQCGTIRPCAAERWVSQPDGAEEKILLRRGDQIYQEDGTPWTATWWTVSGILRACLGDPLSVPPTTDPDAYRALHTGPEGTHWRLHLSGKNPCGIAGSLDLVVDEDKIDLDRLTCGGSPWRKGGRACAMKHRAASLELRSANQKAGD